MVKSCDLQIARPVLTFSRAASKKTDCEKIVKKNRSERDDYLFVYCFQIKLKFTSLSFGRRKTGQHRENSSSIGREPTCNKLNPGE